jgi:hypothetical protein
MPTKQAASTTDAAVEPEIGKRLRLAQQNFLVSCSLQDMLKLLDLAGPEPPEAGLSGVGRRAGPYRRTETC